MVTMASFTPDDKGARRKTTKGHTVAMVLSQYKCTHKFDKIS